jgi:hypothetical protein
MPSRANKEFDWTTRADSGDLVVRSACRQPHLADTLHRRSSTVTDLAPVGEGIGTVRDHSTVGSPETLSINKCTVAMRSDWK